MAQKKESARVPFFIFENTPSYISIGNRRLHIIAIGVLSIKKTDCRIFLGNCDKNDKKIFDKMAILE